MIPLRAQHIDISYATSAGTRSVLKDFNLEMAPGEMIAIIGSNGVGKSSLLRVLSGLQKPNSGQIWWQDQKLEGISMRRRPLYLSNLFSNYARVDGFSVLDLVALGRLPYTGIFGSLSANDREIIEQSINKVGMSSFVTSQIGTLSDGEFRKAMLAKMLAQQAPIMILDEPTTHLDLPSSIEFLKLLKNLCTQEQKSILLSTHNISLIFKMVDRVVLLVSSGEYVIGSPSEIAESELMAQFFKTDEIYFENGDLIFQPRAE